MREIVRFKTRYHQQFYFIKMNREISYWIQPRLTLFLMGNKSKRAAIAEPSMLHLNEFQNCHTDRKESPADILHRPTIRNDTGMCHTMRNSHK